jgi:hypothetical protein
MKTRGFFYFGKFFVLGIAGLILFTFLVMWLWNWLVPEIFNGPVLTYWQTLGVLLLSKILFSGIGKSGGSSKYKCREDSHHPYRDKWRKKYEEKMNGKVEGAGDSDEVIVTE